MLEASPVMESASHFHQVCNRVGLHLLHHLASVRLHCDLADAELATDLLIQQTGDDQRHDLPFARSKCCVTAPELLHLRIRSESEPASFQSLPNRRQQYFVIEWFR